MSSEGSSTDVQKPRRHWRQFSLRTLLLLMVPVAGVAAWVGWKIDQKRPRVVIQQERAAYLLVDVFREEITAADAEQLAELTSSGDRTLALAAGWEQVRRGVQPAPPRQLVDVDRQEIDEFLKLVSQRLRVEPPEFWKQALRQAKVSLDGRVFFVPVVITVGPSNTLPVSDTAASLAVQGSSYVVQQDERSWSIRDDGGLGARARAAALVENGLAYIIVYEKTRPLLYWLYCLDDSGSLRWSSTVWGTGGGVMGGPVGRAYHVAGLAEGELGIVVFGVSEGVAYAELFDRETGEPLCRFCTAYLDWAAM